MGSLGGIERGLGHWHELTTRVSRAAHRLTGSLSRSLRERIVHETSYLPFLFEADSAGPSSGEVSLNAARLRGRRVFNGRGQEIIQTEKIPDVDEGKPSAEDEGGPRGSRKPQTRPVSISGFKAPISIAKKDGKKVRTKTAQMLIREDPLASMPPFPRPPAAASSGFMKPAGIDEPASKGGNSATLKRGREQDPSVDPSDAKGKKRKKKKAEVS